VAAGPWYAGCGLSGDDGMLAQDCSGPPLVHHGQA